MGVICGIVFCVCAVIFAELFSSGIAFLVCCLAEWIERKKKKKDEDEC